MSYLVIRWDGKVAINRGATEIVVLRGLFRTKVIQALVMRTAQIKVADTFIWQIMHL